MNKKSVKLNYIYNLIYQIFTLITPLITAPYVSRVLGSSGVGQYSFTNSIVTYFILFGALGFGYYAQREIARHQGDKVEQSKIFWEIIICRSISVGLSLIFYLVLLFLGVYGEDYTLLMLILTINVVATAFSIEFLFQGNEDFLTIVIKNIVVKVLGILGIFIFVKKPSDVWLYILIHSLITIGSYLSLWTKLPKVLCKVDFKSLNPIRHLKPTLRLFIPTIAVSVYTMLDKTLIGVLIPGETEVNGVIQNISDIENGYYEQSEKIVKMAMTIVTSLGTVMIPRNSQAIASGNLDGFKKNISGALRFVFFVGTPIMFGLAAVANNMCPWFFGDGYEKVPSLMMMFCPLIMIIGFSNVLGLQYLLPMKKDKKYTIAITSGAGVNLVLNLILIRLFWSYGACIATIIAETVVTTIMFIFAKKDISFLELVKNSWRYIISGVTMFALVYFTQYFLAPKIYNTALLVLEGLICYFGLLFIFRDDLVLNYSKLLLNKIAPPSKFSK